MFKQNSESQNDYGSADTTIGPSVKVEGDVKAVGNVHIEGKVMGTVSTDKRVTIGPNAEIHADITADSAEISGTVKGKIVIAKNLALRSNAKVEGDIATGTIEIESGASVNGHLAMGGSVKPVQPQPEKKHSESN